MSSESSQKTSSKSPDPGDTDCQSALLRTDKETKRLEQELGRYHPSTLKSLLSVASYLIDLKRYAAAMDTLVDLRERVQIALFPEHLLSIDVLRQFARLYQHQELTDEAIGFLKLLTKIGREASQCDIERLLEDHLQLAELFSENSAHRAARETLESAIIRCAQDGEISFSPKRLDVVIQLGLLHFQDGEWDRAYDLLTEISTRFSAHSDFDSESQIKINSVLVDILFSAGEFARMEEHLTQLVLNLEDCRDSKDPELHSYRQQLLGIYMQFEMHEEAMSVAKHSYELCKRAFGTQSIEVAEAAFSRGEIAYAAKRYPQARKYLSEALEVFSSAGEKHQRCVAEVLHNLATVAIAESSYHEARFLFEKALKIREEVYGESHQMTIENIFALGTLFKINKQQRLAVTYLRRCRALSKKHLGEDHLLTEQATRSLEQLEADDITPEEAPLSTEETTIHEIEHAETEEEKAPLSVEKKSNRFDSSKFVTNMFNTAVLEFGNQEYRKAINLLARTLEVLERKLGDTHTDLIPVLDQLAEANAALGRDEDAQSYKERADAMRAT